MRSSSGKDTLKDEVTLAGTVGTGPVVRGTVSTRVVLVLGVSIAVVKFDEGVANPLEPVEFEVAVAEERL